MIKMKAATAQVSESVDTGSKRLIRIITDLLCTPQQPELKPEEANDPEFQKLYEHILALRELSSALRCGNLQHFVDGKGFILANLKALQSNLRHLTWQTKQVAAGDFSQKVDFLGEFSDSFNEMTSKLVEANERLYKIASFDGLTQVYNRVALKEFFCKAFAQAATRSEELSIILFDIDYFKRVNDCYGHQAGDQVLIKICTVLREQLRATDILARYGGEEFIAVLPQTGIDKAVLIGNRSLEAVRNTVISLEPDQQITVTVSAGVSGIKGQDICCEDIIKRSDMALYAAKNSGRNRLCML